MKVFRIICLVICVCGLNFYAHSQPCAGFSVHIFVKDQSLQDIKNAKVKAIQLLPDGTRKLNTKAAGFKEDAYFEKAGYNLSFSLPKLGEFYKDDFILRTSAKGFETGEIKVHFPECATRFFEFILPLSGSKTKAEVSELGFLSIGVKDQNGDKIINAKVRAIRANGKIYEAKIDRYGYYQIDLLPTGEYDIEVEWRDKKYQLGKTKITTDRGYNFLNFKL